MFKRFFLLMIIGVMLILSGCGGAGGSNIANDDGLGGSTPPDYNPKEWNFLVYFNGDTNLDLATIGNINQMELVGSTDKVRVLVLVDRAQGSKWSTTRLYYVTYDTDLNKIGSTLLFDYGEKDMSDPNTLKDFIVYCQQTFPAAHTALSIYAHGGGVWPRGVTKPDKQNSKGMSWDNTSYTNDFDCLTTDKMAQALSQARAITSQKLDLFYLDSCIMQMTEVAYEWRNEADYLVGSEEDTFTMNNMSSDYYHILQNLNTIANNGQTSRDFAVSLVDVFYAMNLSRKTTTTISAVDLAHFNQLFPAFQDFAAKLNATGNLAEVKNAYNATTYFAHDIADFHENHDLYDFADKISTSVSDNALVAAANNLKAAIPQVVFYHKETGKYEGTTPAYGSAYGLAILLPKASEWTKYSSGEGYVKLKLAQDSEWDEFIGRFIAVNP